MKSILNLIVPVFLIGQTWIFPCSDDKGSGPSGGKEWIKAATKEYSPDSWALLMQYESLPERTEAESADGRIAVTEKSVSTFHYLEGKSRSELILSMATNVHEIAHAYCGQNIFRHARENKLRLDINKAEEFFFSLPINRFLFLSH